MDTELLEPSAVNDVPPSGLSERDPGSPEAVVDEVDQLLDEVEAALTRLDEGSYGKCRVCADLIDDSRLAERPSVQSCGACDAGGPTSQRTGAGIETPNGDDEPTRDHRIEGEGEVARGAADLLGEGVDAIPDRAPEPSSWPVRPSPEA
jgi:hypothetical protein